MSVKTQIIDTAGNVIGGSVTPIYVQGTLTATVDESTLATAAKQDTGNTSLASLDTKQPAKGTAVMTGSSPVTIASDDTLTSAIKVALTAAAFSTPAAVTGTGSAVALGSAAAIKGVRVQADYTNTTNLRVGDANISTTRGIQLAPGDALFIETANASNIYLIAESGSPKANIMVV